MPLKDQRRPSLSLLPLRGFLGLPLLSYYAPFYLGTATAPEPLQGDGAVFDQSVCVSLLVTSEESLCLDDGSF